MAKPRENAAILRRVAAMAVRDARVAWKRAHDIPSEIRLRKAYRACLLAARTLRKAAAVSPRDEVRILEQAEAAEAARDDMKAQLDRVTGGEIPATAKE